MSKQVLTGAASKLEKHVQRIINSHGKDYDNGAAGFLRDVAYGGCASGVVGELIYYRDTVKFYRQHRAEISELLKETIQEYGAKGPGEIFGENGTPTTPSPANNSIKICSHGSHLRKPHAASPIKTASNTKSPDANSRRKQQEQTK